MRLVSKFQERNSEPDIQGIFVLFEVSLLDLRSAFSLYSSNGYATCFQDVVSSLRSVGCTATLDDIKELYPGEIFVRG